MSDLGGDDHRARSSCRVDRPAYDAKLEIAVSGSGRFDGDELEARNGEVHVSGSGNVVVNLSESLDAEVSGSGDVEYLGNPTVNASTSGSGDISRR